MRLLPDFELGFGNGWVLLGVYAVGFLLAVAALSKEDRARLFADPKAQLRGVRRSLLTIGQLVAVASIVLMVISPLAGIAIPLYLGLVMYGTGYGIVIVSLVYFKRATYDRPVTAGPYRLSRNPQWVGLFLVLAGSAVACGSWLLIGMVAIVAVVYHIQILEEERACTDLYGESYLRYVRKVPRYFLFF